MTIYRLYQENGCRAGFWIQHRRWTNTCGRVITIGGRDSGRLPGSPPRHGDAPVVVLLFDIGTGRALHENEGRSAIAATSAFAATAVQITAVQAPPGAAAEVAATGAIRLDPADRSYVSIAEPVWHSKRRGAATGTRERKATNCRLHG